MLPDIKDRDSGKLYHALELSSPGFEPIVLYVDPDSALIAKQTYVAGGPGQPIIEERFSDYRDGGRRRGGVRRDGDARRPGGPRTARHRHHVQPPARSDAVPTPISLTARLLLSCGEPSGDLYAGALTRELRALDPDVTVAGLGGPQFAAAGGRLIADYRGLSVTGLTEAIAKLPRSWATLRRLTAAARTDRPDALVVIDFPISIFRWRGASSGSGYRSSITSARRSGRGARGRLKTIRDIADLVLVIFPFEEKIYRDAGVPVEFVGHPLVDLAKALRLEGGVSAPARARGGRPDGRHPARQPAERGDADSSDARRGGGADSDAGEGGAVRHRARAEPRRPSVRRPRVKGSSRRSRSSKATPTACWRRPTSR